MEQRRREYNQVRPDSTRNYLPLAAEAIMTVALTKALDSLLLIGL